MTPTPTPGDLVRKARTPIPRCKREGCPRPKARGEEQYCTVLCYRIAKELQRAERMCRDAGSSPASTELWVSAVALADALSEYARAQHQVRLMMLAQR